MVVVTTRVKRQVVSNPKLMEDVMMVFTELDRLVEYYKDEIKQLGIENGRAKNPIKIAYNDGAMRAYGDHIGEVNYLADVLRGWHRDMEEK